VASALAVASLRADWIVATDVVLIFPMVLAFVQRPDMPHPGLIGLNVLFSTRMTAALKFVATLWLNWPLEFLDRASFLMALRTCSRVVARAVKHASAMVAVGELQRERK
jgi:hypothetical protein